MNFEQIATISALKFRSNLCTWNVRKSMHMYRDKAQCYGNNIFISFLWEISAHNVSLWMNSNVEMKEKKENFSSHSLEMFMNNDSRAITLTPWISRSFFLIASFPLSFLDTFFSCSFSARLIFCFNSTKKIEEIDTFLGTIWGAQICVNVCKHSRALSIRVSSKSSC